MPLIVPQVTAQGSPAPSYSLTVDGVDVLLRRQDGAAPNIGTPLNSIELVHQGPGGVSSLRFRIEDPGTSMPLPSDGSVVLYWDLVNDVPLFRGRVTKFDVLPVPPGRWIEVECTGPEVALDTVLPEYVINSSVSSSPQRDTQELMSFARPALPPGIGPWGANQFDTMYDGESPQYINLGVPRTVTSTTIRQALAEVWATVIVHPIPVTASFQPPFPNWTVDMYGYPLWYPGGQQPSTWTTLTISDTAAGAIAAKNLSYQVVPGDMVHEVYVSGADAASSGWFSDGTGITGQTAQITDSAIDTANKAREAATAYMNSVAPDVRGSFRVSGVTLPPTVNPGGLVTITDAQAGLSAQTFTIYTITKRWLGGVHSKQEWTIDFGGRRPSAMAQVRNLTREVLN